MEIVAPAAMGSCRTHFWCRTRLNSSFLFHSLFFKVIFTPHLFLKKVGLLFFFLLPFSFVQFLTLHDSWDSSLPCSVVCG